MFFCNTWGAADKYLILVWNYRNNITWTIEGGKGERGEEGIKSLDLWSWAFDRSGCVKRENHKMSNFVIEKRERRNNAKRKGRPE